MGQQTSGPFTVRLSDGLGNPIGGAGVTFGVAPSAAIFPRCNAAECVVGTDGNGEASIFLGPLAAGQITVSATTNFLLASASFTAVGTVATLSVVQQPGSAGAIVSVPFTYIFKLVGPDGVTPVAGQSIALQVVQGSVAFPYCGSTTFCGGSTDQNGLASMYGVPSSLGTEQLLATYGNLTATITYDVRAANDVLSLVSAPASGAVVNTAASMPLVVQVFNSDGVTPVPAGRTVALSVSAGSATYQACAGASSCSVTTDASGRISTVVTPLAAGSITLLATEGGGNQSATFTAAAAADAPAQPDLMHLNSLPPDGTRAGATGSTPFSVTVYEPDGVTPAAGRIISLTVSSGAATFSLCGLSTCSVTTAADGVAASPVTPSAAGTIVLAASETSAGTVVTAGGSFVAVAAPDLLTISVAPAASVNVGSATSLTVQALLADGVTPAASKTVSFQVSAGSAALGPCIGAGGCIATSSTVTATTDTHGLASIAITPVAAGGVSVTATEGGASVTASFNASTPAPLPDSISLISAPAGSTPVGQANATAFAVKLLQGDGITPATGQSIAFAVTAGSATLAACGASTCTVVTSAGGIASTTVTPTSAGFITVTATEIITPTNTLSATFTAVQVPVTPPPANELLTITASPGASAFVGTIAPTPLTVFLTLADGLTPVAGVAVTFSNSGGPGQVSFTACGLPTCTITTNAAGLASTSVLASQPGAVLLVASAPSPGSGLPAPSVSASFQINADQLSLIALQPDSYLAEATTEILALSASANENGAPAASQTVLWSTTNGPAQLASTQTVTLADGSASTQATVGPLAGGERATVTACAWTSVCANFNATGVAASTFVVTITSGGWQTLSSSNPPGFAPVQVKVTDGSGHAVAGATVSVYQTVTAAPIACPVEGRCPAEPVLASATSLPVSDANGTITATPLTIGQSSTETQMAFSAGTQGFATTVLTSLP